MVGLIRDQKNRSPNVFQLLLRDFGKEERAQREHTNRILLDQDSDPILWLHMPRTEILLVQESYYPLPARCSSWYTVKSKEYWFWREIWIIILALLLASWETLMRKPPYPSANLPIFSGKWEEHPPPRVVRIKCNNYVEQASYSYSSLLCPWCSVFYKDLELIPMAGFASMIYFYTQLKMNISDSTEANGFPKALEYRV